MFLKISKEFPTLDENVIKLCYERLYDPILVYEILKLAFPDVH